MKLAFGSDLHFEFGGPRPSVDGLAGIDALILAGDIVSGRGGLDDNPRLIDYAASYADELNIPVVVVAGNHEFYGEEYHRFIADCRRVAADNPLVHFLENASVRIGDVRVLGCTLWTDFAFDRNPSSAMREALIAITDYRVIGFDVDGAGEEALRPRHTLELNRTSRRFLEAELQKHHDGPTVVVTHFPPVFMSAPQYEGDMLSPYFNNDWGDDIAGGGLSPDLWICGHTHYSKEVMVGRTRVMSNQAGYPGELEPFHWSIVEV